MSPKASEMSLNIPVLIIQNRQTHMLKISDDTMSVLFFRIFQHFELYIALPYCSYIHLSLGLCWNYMTVNCPQLQYAVYILDQFQKEDSA